MIKHEKEEIKITNDIKDEKNNAIKKKIFDIHKIDNDETSTSTEEKVLKKKGEDQEIIIQKKKLKSILKKIMIIYWKNLELLLFMELLNF